MTWQSVPWLEMALAVSFFGGLLISRVRQPRQAMHGCVALTGVTFACTVPAYVLFLVHPEAVSVGLSEAILGRTVWRLDPLNAPLVPGIALLHLLTVLGTARTKLERFSFTRLLLGNALRMALFASTTPTDVCVWLLVGILPPYLELRARRQPTGVYTFHMGLFALLLVGGMITTGTLAVGLFLAAALVRSGTFPVHVWVVDLLTRASFGTALLTVVPLAGMYAAVRLVLVASPPDWLLMAVGGMSLGTALYAATLALIQTDLRRFFAYFSISQSALVLVGMELHTDVSLTGALALWISVALSLLGFGLTLRALEARFDRITLHMYHGYYAAAPLLAMSYLLTGLATIGFPGTAGFLALELLVDGALSVNPVVGIIVILVTACHGVALLRVYFLLFTGAAYSPNVRMRATWRERVCLLTIAGLLFAFGFAPSLIVHQRYEVAQRLRLALAAPAAVLPADH